MQSGRPGPMLNCSTDANAVNWIVTIRGEIIRIFGADEFLSLTDAKKEVYFTK